MIQDSYKRTLAALLTVALLTSGCTGTPVAPTHPQSSAAEASSSSQETSEPAMPSLPPEQIPTSTKWDLTAVYRDFAAAQNELNILKQEILPPLTEHVANLQTAADVVAYSKLFDASIARVMRLSDYRYLQQFSGAQAEGLEPFYAEVAQFCDTYDELSAQVRAFALAQDDAFWQQLLSAPEMENTWNRMYADMRAYERAHGLSDTEQTLLQPSYDARESFRALAPSIRALAVQPDAVPPENGDVQAWRTYTAAWSDQQLAGLAPCTESLAQNLTAFLRLEETLASAEGYTSSLQERMETYGMSTAAFHTLVSGARDQLELAERANRMRAERLGHTRPEDQQADQFRVTRDLPAATLEQARQQITAALLPLGTEYGAIVDQAFFEGWIDTAPGDPSQNYTYPVYGVHPYLRVAFDGSLDGMSSLARHLGRAAHQQMSAEAQHNSMFEADVLPLYLSETVSDLLVLRYLADQAQGTDAELPYLLRELGTLDMMFFDAARVSAIEQQAHELIVQGYELTPERLGEITMQEAVAFAPGLTPSGQAGLGWANMAELYTPYMGSLNMAAVVGACQVAEDLEAGDTHALDKYLQMLKAGSSKEAGDLFAAVGVPLAQDGCMEAFARRYTALLDRIEPLLA